MCLCIINKFTYFGTCLNNNYIVNKSKILDFHHNLSIDIYIFFVKVAPWEILVDQPQPVLTLSKWFLYTMFWVTLNTLSHSNPLWVTLTHYGSLWPLLSHSDPLWVTLTHYGSIWPTMSHSDLFWVTLTHSESLWPILCHSNPLWVTMTHSDNHWPN